MPLHLGWPEILLRLALTVVAGGLIGFNRTERGRPAGLRTTILVCLAACVAMIEANQLLITVGKASDSFVVMDIMRLPLGILTGMGFIGAGAILRRGDRVQGITTAATLWLVTVIGLCFGGGQIYLGLAALALAIAVLWGLRWIELLLPADQRGTLLVTAAEGGPGDDELREQLRSGGYAVVSYGITYFAQPGRPRATLRYVVQWTGRRHEERTPALLSEIRQKKGVESVRWKQ